MRKILLLLASSSISIWSFSSDRSCLNNIQQIKGTKIDVIECAESDQECVIKLQTLKCLEDNGDPAAILVYTGQDLKWQGDGNQKYKLQPFVEVDCTTKYASGSDDDNPFEINYSKEKFGHNDRSGKVDKNYEGRCFKHEILIAGQKKGIDPHVIIEPPGTELIKLESKKRKAADMSNGQASKGKPSQE